jgi:hypothetical protein
LSLEKNSVAHSLFPGAWLPPAQLWSLGQVSSYLRVCKTNLVIIVLQDSWDNINKFLVLLLCYYYAFEIIGFLLRVLCFLSLEWHSPSPFCFSHFSDMVLCFSPWAAIIHDPPTYTSCKAGMRGVHHQAQLVLWDRVLLTRATQMASNHTPPISTSQVAGLTSTSHCTHDDSDVLVDD